MTDEAINKAIHECLARCYESREPLAGLAAYLEKLRTGGWKAADILKVDTGVRHLLQGIVEPDGGIPTDSNDD